MTTYTHAETMEMVSRARASGTREATNRCVSRAREKANAWREIGSSVAMQIGRSLLDLADEMERESLR